MPKSRIAEVKNPASNYRKAPKIRKTNFLLPVGVLVVVGLIITVSVGLMNKPSTSEQATVALSNPSSNIAAADNANGMVVTPDTGDHAGLVTRIKNFFSDDVNVSFDQDNDTGVITPVFRNGTTSDHYAFVMVPVNKTQ